MTDSNTPITDQMDLTCAAEFGRSALGQTTLDMNADAAANLAAVKAFDLMDGEMVPELMCPNTHAAINMLFEDPEASGMDLNETLIAMQNGTIDPALLANQPTDLLAQTQKAPENLLDQRVL